MKMRYAVVACLLALAWVAPSVAQDAAKEWHEKARELGKANKLAEADQAYREAIKGYEEVTRSKALPAVWEAFYRCQCDHAGLYTQMERFAEAEKKLKGILAELPANDPTGVRQHTKALAHDKLGEMYRAMERSALAVVQFDEEISVLRKLVEELPAAPGYREELACALGERAHEQMNLARYQDAEASYRECLQIWHKLIVENPRSPEYREKLALACNGYGVLAREAGRFMLARDLFRSAVQTIEALSEAFPREPKYWYHLPTFYRNLSMGLDYLYSEVEKRAALRAADRWERRLADMSDGTKSWVTEGQKILGSLQAGDDKKMGEKREEVEAFLAQAEKIARAHPDVPYYRGRWLAAKITAATRLASVRSFEQALTSYQDTLADSASLIRDFPAVPKYRRLHAALQTKVGLVQYLKGNDKEAARVIDDAAEQFRKLADAFPDEPKLARALDDEMANLMIFHLSRGEEQKVIDMMRAMAESLAKVCAKHPRCPEYRRNHAQAPVPLGHLFARMKQDADAERAFLDSLRLWTKLIEDFPETAEYGLFQGQVRSHLVQLYYRNQRWADAEAMVMEMRKSHEKLIAALPQLAHQHTGLAVSHVWLATLAVKQKREQAAIAHYTQAIAACEKAFAAAPTQREHLQIMIGALRERSTLHHETRNFAGYDCDLKRSQDWSEWLDTPFVRLTRMAHRLENGQAESARRDAEDLFASGELLSASQWFELAAVYAKLLRSANPAMREGYASRTITTLRKALDEGYLPTTPLGDDGQFRLLATRPEFQQLAVLASGGR